VVRASKGDTVASLARRHRVSAANVADWNDVKVGTAFKAGQQVVLFVPVRMATRAQGGTKKAGQKKTSPSRRGGKPSKAKRR
jgi:membrane-bound lytic murein transglycosylase D